MTREHTPRPGVTWEARPVRREEYTPDCPASTLGDCLAACMGGDICAVQDGECVHAAPDPEPPTSSRAARRAVRRNR